MSRKLISVAVLAFLSLSTAGAVQARPAASPAASPSGFAGTLLRWVSSGVSGLFNKDGIGLDPNGAKNYAVHRAPGAGTPHGRAAGEGK